jgi:bifunctional pyridoxal-dependent enzyme with beta-cystathionase and maltose regulon repressor activities
MFHAPQFELRLAERMSRLGTETAFEVLNRARALEQQGKDIIHLEIGEPDFDTPSNIVDSGIEALRSGWTHYGPSAGLPELREAIAQEVSRARGVPVAPDEVVVVPGGKPIIFFSILALIDDDDEVIYPNPGFPIYESMIRYVGGRAVPIPLREEKDFSFDVEEFAGLITDHTRMIILNSPQNPTGGVLGKRDIEQIAAAIGDGRIVDHAAKPLATKAITAAAAAALLHTRSCDRDVTLAAASTAPPASPAASSISRRATAMSGSRRVDSFSRHRRSSRRIDGGVSFGSASQSTSRVMTNASVSDTSSLLNARRPASIS